MQASAKPEFSVNIVTNVTTPASRETSAALPMRMTISKLNFFYGPKQILFDINMGIADKKVTALIGPSGCGKSTLLRTLNRMYETVSTSRLEGEILLDSQNILAQDVTALRRRIGMVFQRPNPFPKSIFDNVAYGPRINGYKGSLADTVEKSLRHAPCSALDPISTAKIEELMVELKNLTTIAIVTHNMQQAARVSDFTAFLLTGQIIEFSPTPHLFTTPSDPRTEAYITGRFG
jgi:phosphate transport system ATP-binding protein